MDHDGLEAWRKAGNLRGPVREQRGRSNQKARFRLILGLVLQHQQQGQNLDGLAEPHVVRKASAKPELGQQTKPLHPRLLIGPERSPEGLTRVDKGTGGTAQGRERLGQPGTGHGLAPVNVGVSGGPIRGDAGSCQHAHRFAERQTLGDCASFDDLNLLQGSAQAFPVDLDPSAAHEGQAVGLCQEPLDFGFRESLAVKRHLRPEVEQRIHSHV